MDRKISNLTETQLKMIRRNLQMLDATDDETREAAQEYVNDLGDIADLMPSYGDISGTGRNADAAQFTATFPNGNEPDGSCVMVIHVRGADDTGYILECHDDAGGPLNFAGETIYATFDDATTAAVDFAESHDEA